MTFVFWMTLILGITFTVGALVIGVLECLIERGKPATERSLRAALKRCWGSMGGTLLGGVLLIAIAVAMHDPDLGFRLLMVPLGVIGAAMPLIHLVSSMKAEKENRPEEERQWWQGVANKSGDIMQWCAYSGVVIASVYAFYSVANKVETLTGKVQTLEERVEELSGKLKS